MPTRRPVRSVLAVLLVLAASSAAVPSGEGALEIRDGGTGPGGLSRLGDPAGRLAIAVADDGERVAAAFPAAKDPEDSRVAVTGPGEDPPVEWVVDGLVVALRFGPEATWLAAVVERTDRGGRRSASLAVFDLARPDRRPRILTLPASARGLAVRRGDGRIAVASDGEIRTFEPPTLRSGRVFAVAGANRSVAFVPGGNRILIGRPDGVWSVDLAAQQERDGMPVGSRAATDGPVVEIAVSPDGTRALARLEGDRVVEIAVDPLAVEPTGRIAESVAWPARGEPVPVPAVEAPASPAEPPPPPVPPPAAPAPPPPTPAPPPATPPESPPESPPEAASEPAALPEGQVAGRLTGPARSRAAAIRLLGPDSILREASRVPVAEDGTWVADGLLPGVYRVMAEGEGGAVLTCSPPFRTVRVEEGARVEVEPIEVRSAVR
jgi:hypothetical protein